MKFEDFIKKGEVRKASLDSSLIKSLISMAKNDLEFLEGLKIDERSSRKIMVNYYDTLRGILEAFCSLEGYKVYSHEAFTYFLREKNEESLSIKFDRFRKTRNSINYYAQDISVEETKENVREIKEMVKYLISKYLERFV